MHGYTVVPLLSCVALAMLAAAILARDARHRANRLAAGLVGGACWWAGCELLWNTADDPVTVMRLIRLSSLGWGPLGPLALHLFLEIAGDRVSRARRLLPALYVLAGGAIAFTLAGGLHSDVTRHAWGWSYRLSPAYLVFYVFTTSCIVEAQRILYRAYRHSPARAEQEQMVLLLAGINFALGLASITDGLLPVAGIQLPRLGTAAFAVLAATIAWTFYRYTFPILAPGLFGKEILENLRDGVGLLRLDGRLRTSNEALGRLVGCPIQELVDRHASELIPSFPPDPKSEVDDLECELVCQSGRRIPVSISTAILHDREEQQAVGIVLSVRDLREVVGLRNRLVISGRLAAVGELAAGIAHEINNPIAYVRSNLAQLGKAWEELGQRLGGAADRELLDEGRAMIDESLEGVDRAAAIVRDIKGFSHAGRAMREPVDVNQLLEAVIRVAAPQVRYRARIETVYTDVPRVCGAPQELKQIFLNLILNAAQAVREGGRIRISTIAVASDVFVLVEDEGCGMAAELLPRVFDPFFTTKKVGEGTGLGLAIAYQIARNHGGDITVESEPERGTIVRVRLPAAGSGGEAA